MMKEIIEEAYARKNEDLTQYVWKGRKTHTNDGKVLQNEVRLVDASPAALNEYYNHCLDMLYNDDKINPGRYLVLDIIKDQRERCNCELFLRYVETEKGIKKPAFLAQIRGVIDNNPDVIMDPKNHTVSDIVGSPLPEFADINLDLVMDGCLDRLGKFYRKHITLAFILKQGIWFTPQESKELVEKDSAGIERNKMDVVRERLGLDPGTIIRATPRGLSYSQFRAMVKLRSNKYSDLSTIQLQTLRDRILFILEDDVKFHIRQWEERISQIKKVAEFNGIELFEE